MTVGFLLVTCCLEPTRAHVLRQVIDNIRQEAPELLSKLTVFDNASTQDGIVDDLTSTFKHVVVSDRNVGYWSAIDWWLDHVDPQPRYTYIIESDMIQYDFHRLNDAVEFLNENEDVGAVRLHEYSVANKHLYNKDVPVKGSKTNIWQSHVNKASGQPIKIDPVETKGIHKANFLTQLPALNRFNTLKSVFKTLRETRPSGFSEPDFQRLYHEHFPMNAIIDGGIFHCNPGAFGAPVATGSWTPAEELAKMGYHGTRQGIILPQDQYHVTRLL